MVARYTASFSGCRRLASLATVSAVAAAQTLVRDDGAQILRWQAPTGSVDAFPLAQALELRGPDGGEATANPYALVGFATVAGVAYGGHASGSITTVPTHAALLAVSRRDPYATTILVTANFCVVGRVTFNEWRAGLTLDGQGHVLQSIAALVFENSHNVVVKDVTFECRDGDALVVKNSHHVAVTACSFWYGAPEIGVFQDRCTVNGDDYITTEGLHDEICDEGISLEDSIAFVTVQRCLMYRFDEGFDSKGDDTDTSSVTYSENVWYQAKSRAPKAEIRRTHVRHKSRSVVQQHTIELNGGGPPCLVTAQVLNNVWINDRNEVDDQADPVPYEYAQQHSIQTTQNGTVVAEGCYAHNIGGRFIDEWGGDLPKVHLPGCARDYVVGGVDGPENAECTSNLQLSWEGDTPIAPWTNAELGWTIPYAYAILDVFDEATVELLIRNAGSVRDRGWDKRIDPHFGDVLTDEERTDGEGRDYDYVVGDLQLHSDWLEACGLASPPSDAQDGVRDSHSVGISMWVVSFALAAVFWSALRIS